MKSETVDRVALETPTQSRCTVEECTKLIDVNGICHYHRTTCHSNGCNIPNVDGVFCQSHWLENEQRLEESAAYQGGEADRGFRNWRGNLEGLDLVLASRSDGLKRIKRQRLIETRDKPVPPKKRARVDQRSEKIIGKSLDSITPREAEFLAASWMKQLGLGPNQVTQSSRDGGIDVDSESWAAQVKFQSQPISVGAVRQIFGAKQPAQRAIFFSKSDFTSSSVDFANQRGVALFVFKSGYIEPKSKVAESLIQKIL